MAEFNLPSQEECEIVLKKNDGTVVGTLDCLDVVLIRNQAVEESDKLGMEDFWDLVLDKLEAKYHLGIKHKCVALALYATANDMLVELKKKSSQSQSQLDSTESLQDGELES